MYKLFIPYMNNGRLIYLGNFNTVSYFIYLPNSEESCLAFSGTVYVH